MTAERGAVGNGPPFERTTTAPAPGHPPCPEDCWEAVGPGWHYVRPVNRACRWDDGAKKWTRCVPDESEHK